MADKGKHIYESAIDISPKIEYGMAFGKKTISNYGVLELEIKNAVNNVYEEAEKYEGVALVLMLSGLVFGLYSLSCEYENKVRTLKNNKKDYLFDK